MLFGQQQATILSGLVRDFQSGENLASVNIRILGTSTGTSTNLEGAYRILLVPGKHRLLLSCVGYQSDTLDVEVDSAAMTCDVALQIAPIPLPDEVVLGDPRDPGEQIIGKAIDNKRKFLSQLHAYRFNAYTKTTLRVARASNGTQDTVIGGLLETQTQGTWEAPDHFKELITARRQSANFTRNQNIFAVGPIPNLNDDIVTIESNSIVGPTAPDAFEYYAFKMIDTTAMDNIRVYRIRMRPKSTSRPLFDGVIAIADKSFQVMSVDVQGNEAFDLAPLTNARMRQRFALFDKKFWLPIESRTTYTVNITFPPVPPILWEQYSLMYKYEINPELPQGTFDRYMLSSLPTADRVDSIYWQSMNVLPLTYEESSAYERLDSIITHANLFVRSILWLTRLPLGFDELPITDVSDFFHFNRVEGTYLGGGFKFTPFSPRTTVTVRAGYGFADERMKYSAGVERQIRSDKTLSVGAEVYRTLTYRAGEEFISPGEITLYALLDKNDPVDYYRHAGWSAFACGKPFEAFSLEIRYRDENQQSVVKHSDFSLFRTSENFPSNPPVLEGDLRSAQVLLTYDTRKFIDMGIEEAPDNSKNNLYANILIERSDKNIFDSDFQFTMCTARVHSHLLTFGTGAFDGYFKIGYALGGLPPQRIFDLFGTTSSISHEGSLRTIGNRDYAGDRIASLLLEHNFGSLPFRTVGIPFMRSMDFILSAGGAWTGLSEESKALQTVPLQTTRNAIVELGFGLGRLLTFFRLDFSWRLTEVKGDNFVLTLGSSVF